MQKISQPIIALTALSLALNACQTTSPDRFDQADKNHNGSLSRDEINTHLVSAIFDTRDANHDQKMTKASGLSAMIQLRKSSFASVMPIGTAL
jgi:hypothetical protein